MTEMGSGGKGDDVHGRVPRLVADSERYRLNFPCVYLLPSCVRHIISLGPNEDRIVECYRLDSLRCMADDVLACSAWQTA